MNKLNYNEGFYKTKLDEEGKVDTFTVRLNKEERSILNKYKFFSQQPKDSTALKDAAFGFMKFVLHDPQTTHLRDSLFKNIKNNKRTGWGDIEEK
jgi:hypothetical protein